MPRSLVASANPRVTPIRVSTKGVITEIYWPAAEATTTDPTRLPTNLTFALHLLPTGETLWEATDLNGRVVQIRAEDERAQLLLTGLLSRQSV